MKFQKHEYVKEEKRSVRPQKDVRAPHERAISDSELKSFYEEVKIVGRKTGKKVGLSFILPYVPLQNNDPEPAAQDPRDSELNWRLVSTEKVHPMSLDEIPLKVEQVKKRLFDSASERVEIERATINQHTSILWYNVRQPRITASQTKRCLLKESTSPAKAIQKAKYSNEAHEGGHWYGAQNHRKVHQGNRKCYDEMWIFHFRSSPFLRC